MPRRRKPRTVRRPPMAVHQRRRLEAELAQVRRRLGIYDTAGAERGGDEQDIAVASTRHDVETMTAAQLHQRAVSLRRAIERLDVGEWGICEHCDHPIEPKRLEVMPEANLCRACQERAEREAEEPEVGIRRMPRPTRGLEELEELEQP